MARARLAWRNHALTATLTASAAAAGTPASNLANPHPKVPWRAPAGFEQAVLLADLGALLPIGLVALDALTLPKPTVRVRISASDPAGEADLVYDSGVFTAALDPVHPKLVRFLPAEVTGRYVRIDFGAPNPAVLGVAGIALGLPGGGELWDDGTTWDDGTVWVTAGTSALGFEDTIVDFERRIGAGRLWVGSAVELARSYSHGWKPLAEERDEEHRSGDGMTWKLIRPAARGARLTFRGIPASEAMTIIEEINAEAGTARDVIVCRDPASPSIGRDTYWGMLGAPIDNTHLMTTHHTALVEVWERI